MDGICVTRSKRHRVAHSRQRVTELSVGAHPTQAVVDRPASNHSIAPSILYQPQYLTQPETSPHHSNINNTPNFASPPQKARMAPQGLNFITGNANKLLEVRAILGDCVTLHSREVDVPEIQGSIEEVSKDKARRAAEAVCCPLTQ